MHMKRSNYMILLCYFMLLFGIVCYFLFTSLQGTKYWDTRVYNEFITSWPDPYVRTTYATKYFKVSYFPHFYLLYFPMAFFSVIEQYLLIVILTMIGGVVSLVLNYKLAPKYYAHAYAVVFLMVGISAIEFGNLEGILFIGLNGLVLFLYKHTNVSNLTLFLHAFMFALLCFKLYSILWICMYLPMITQKRWYLISFVVSFLAINIPFLVLSSYVRDSIILMLIDNPIWGISARKGVFDGLHVLNFLWMLFFRMTITFFVIIKCWEIKRYLETGERLFLSVTQTLIGPKPIQKNDIHR